MGKFLLIGILFFSVMSCKQEAEEENNIVEQEVFFSVDSLPRPVGVDVEVQEALEGWQAFSDMEITFESLYRVENREDLSLVIEDLIEKQKLLETSDYPVEFDRPQIRSRQKVFQTFILKAKGSLEYRVNVEESVIEMITAYNAYRNQLNVLINSDLDLNLFLNE